MSNKYLITKEEKSIRKKKKEKEEEKKRSKHQEKIPAVLSFYYSYRIGLD